MRESTRRGRIRGVIGKENRTMCESAMKEGGEGARENCSN